jgi:hypothetical protein
MGAQAPQLLKELLLSGGEVFRQANLNFQVKVAGGLGRPAFTREAERVAVGGFRRNL